MAKVTGGTLIAELSRSEVALIRRALYSWLQFVGGTNDEEAEARSLLADLEGA